MALIYVAPGQEDEISIFLNQDSSSEYQEFVSSLGWEIDVATHPGYLGGLNKNLADGVKAIYYCSSTIEIIYHDATRMVNDEDDPKQVKKKRHIGNDQVHVIWNEHAREYRRETIKGDFGNALIVVTPQASGLFLIELYRDQRVRLFIQPLT